MESKKKIDKKIWFYKVVKGNTVWTDKNVIFNSYSVLYFLAPLASHTACEAEFCHFGLNLIFYVCENMYVLPVLAVSDARGA